MNGLLLSREGHGYSRSYVDIPLVARGSYEKSCGGRLGGMMKDDIVNNVTVTKTTLISIDPSVTLTDFKSKITRPYTILYVEEKKQELR